MAEENGTLCKVPCEEGGSMDAPPGKAGEKKPTARRYLVRAQINEEILQAAIARAIAILENPRREAEGISALMLALANEVIQRRETTNITEIAVVQRMAITHAETFRSDRGLSDAVRALLDGMESGRVTAERITVEKGV